MYARLHINTPAQASRMLPVLVPLTPSLSLSVSGVLGAAGQGALESVPRFEVGEQDPAALKALLDSVAPMQLGFSRLFELWGIARATVMVNTILTGAGEGVRGGWVARV